MRHGQTDWNNEERIQGQTDIPLNAMGREQAQQAQKYIESLLNIKHIFYSPLQRTHETMHIACHTVNVPKIAVNELKERYRGNLEGKTYAQIMEMNVNENDPWGGETNSQHQERIVEGINYALSYESYVLIIAHGGTYHALCHYMGVEYKGIENCELVVCVPSLIYPVWSVEPINYPLKTSPEKLAEESFK
jgi:uncharacterized phosphatase